MTTDVGSGVGWWWWARTASSRTNHPSRTIRSVKAVSSRLINLQDRRKEPQTSRPILSLTRFSKSRVSRRSPGNVPFVMSQKATIPLPHSASVVHVSCSLGLRISNTRRVRWRGDCWNTSCQWSTSIGGQFADHTHTRVQCAGFFVFFFGQVYHPVRAQKALCNEHRHTEQIRHVHSKVKWSSSGRVAVRKAARPKQGLHRCDLRQQHIRRLMVEKVEHCTFLKCVRLLNSTNDALEATIIVWICNCFHINIGWNLNRITLISAYRDIDFLYCSPIWENNE